MSVEHPHPIIIRFGRLGDMIMLTALLSFLHYRYRSPCQVIGAGSWNLDIYRGHPDVAQVWSFARHFPFPLSSAWPRVLWAMYRNNPAPIYVCEHLPRQLSRIRRLLKSCGVEPSRCVFITEQPSHVDEHWVDRLVRFGRRTPPASQEAFMPSPPVDRVWAPRLQVSDRERAERDAWIRANGWSDRELVLIQPGNFRSMSRSREQWSKRNADDKAWPAERWAALFSRIHDQLPRAAIVLCGASQEVPMLRRIQQASDPGRVTVADLSLRQLFALCESAHSMISVDSGPAHAAAALGVPLVVMYGSESPRHWLPRSQDGSPVLAVGGPPTSTRVDQLAVDVVFDSWCSLLRSMPVSAPVQRHHSCTHAPSATRGPRPTMSAPPLRPTVFYFCRLGDMVMLTSLLNLLHRRYHLPCHIIGAGSWNASIYPGNPDVAAVWSFGRHLPFPLDSAWSQVRRALRDSNPGPIYICERHYRQLPRIRRMLAMSGVNPARCVFITDEPETGPDHLVNRLVRLAARTPSALRATDYPALPGVVADGPRLYVLDTERGQRDAWIEAQGWPHRQYILIQPGNHRTMGPRRDRWRRLNTDDKAWPLDRWAALLHLIHARLSNATIVLRGAPEEVPMLKEIQTAAGLHAVVVAGNGLRQFFALAASAHSMISVDSGPAHAAAALSVPLVVLYGAESPRYWLPRSPAGSPVIGVGGPPGSTRADQVPVDAVFDAWCSLVQQASLARLASIGKEKRVDAEG